MIDFNYEQINWQKSNGLIPAIIQDYKTGQVLMLGFMNEAALQATLQTKKVTFYSRTRQSLWTKGETSGNFLQCIKITSDCDADSLLIFATPQGPTCHDGTASCFKQSEQTWQIIPELSATIQQRAQENSSTSYSANLLNQGLAKVAQKVGEEAVEVVIAALQESDDRLFNELADLIYHILILLEARQLSGNEVLEILRQRSKKKKIPRTQSDQYPNLTLVTEPHAWS